MKKPRKSRKLRKPRRSVLIDGPRAVDVHVGNRLRLRRMLLGVSQEKLGQAVDLTFQQIQKYERGANRVGASRLYEFSRILGVSVEFFFEEMSKEVGGTKSAAQKAGLSDAAQKKIDGDPMRRRETLELVRAYYGIPDPKVRKRIYELIRSIGNVAR